MGTLIGHVLPGLAFVALGVWHLYNIILGYLQSPCQFRSRAWWEVSSSNRNPNRKKQRWLRHLELYFIAAAASLSIASELFIFPAKHQPLAEDWSIPSNHLQNFEHSSISLFFLGYALVALAADVAAAPPPPGLLHIVAAAAFAAEWLLFHLHSADHMGLEGHYHWLLQLLIVVCMLATLAEAASLAAVVDGQPVGLLPGVVRSTATVMQGVWMVNMGLVLWVPSLTPTGCEIDPQNVDKKVVICHSHNAEHRAKALATLQFNWCVALVLFSVTAIILCGVAASSHTKEYAPLHMKSGLSGCGEESGHRGSDE